MRFGFHLQDAHALRRAEKDKASVVADGRHTSRHRRRSADVFSDRIRGDFLPRIGSVGDQTISRGVDGLENVENGIENYSAIDAGQQHDLIQRRIEYRRAGFFHGDQRSIAVDG